MARRRCSGAGQSRRRWEDPTDCDRSRYKGCPQPLQEI